MKAESKNAAATAPVSVDLKHITNVVFACDAGMGSSAMGAAVLQKKFKKAGLTDITVSHASVSEVPADATTRRLPQRPGRTSQSQRSPRPSDYDY